MLCLCPDTIGDYPSKYRTMYLRCEDGEDEE